MSNFPLNLMEIALDFSFFSSIAHLPPHLAAWQLLIHGGWLIFVIPFLYILPGIWLDWRQRRYARNIQFTLLALDIPKNLERTAKAMEQVFSHLAGAHAARDWYDKWWIGVTQPYFSFEIISIEGYIQFLVYMPKSYRDIVEAAVYAQYPDVLITEVEDYTRNIPNIYPSETHDVWGSELKLRNNDMYPIRTHPAFEHQLTQEFLDPLGDMMEMLARFNQGEQFWLQIIVTAINQNWRERGAKLINQIVGRKIASEGMLSKLNFFGIGDELQKLTGEMRDQITGLFGPAGEGAAQKPTENMDVLARLTPGERESLVAIHEKISKTGFHTRLRMVYVARKEVMNKTKAVNGIMGALRQFDSLTLNGIKPNKKYGTFAGHFIFPDRIRNFKKGKVIRAYKRREQGYGTPQVMNIEELATLYHPPTLYVKTANLMQADAKRGAAPTTLPLERTMPQVPEREESPESTLGAHSFEQDNKEAVPDNLPVA